MHLPRSLHRALGWLARLALVVHALVPFAAGLMASTAEAGYVEVCTARGITLVRLPDAPDTPQPTHSAGGASCPFCAFHAGAPVLPSQAPAFVALPEHALLLAVPDVLDGLRPPPPHLIARPRDPPRLS